MKIADEEQKIAWKSRSLLKKILNLTEINFKFISVTVNHINPLNWRETGSRGWLFEDEWPGAKTIVEQEEVLSEAGICVQV